MPGSTTVNEWLPLALALAVGMLLGAFFFGGLWWTVVRGVVSPQPALWFLSSMLLRTSVTLAGFWYVGRTHWERCLVCVLGFVLARLLVQRLTRRTIELPDSRAAVAPHAP
jgi:F1F0 ATPase subunit 2